MSSSNKTDLGNKPIVVIIGLIASIIGIIAFFSGKQSIQEFFSGPESPSNHVSVTVVVSQPTNIPIEDSQDILDPQFDPDNPEGFLRWYFHQIWATRSYDYLWEYLSLDFRQRLDMSYSSFEDNWNAIGSINEPIDITYEGKDGISQKYRVKYTTLSKKSGYTDNRNDLYYLYFNANKGHWEFK
ncbi:MAG: hypothetical protein IPP66_22660 [Anaerolineales bacterium]|nr:hypothetical protein [Anaerolineales bacterium]